MWNSELDDTYQQTEPNETSSSLSIAYLFACQWTVMLSKANFHLICSIWSGPICAFIVNIRIKYCLLNVYAFPKAIAIPVYT